MGYTFCQCLLFVQTGITTATYYNLLVVVFLACKCQEMRRSHVVSWLQFSCAIYLEFYCHIRRKHASPSRENETAHHAVISRCFCQNNQLLFAKTGWHQPQIRSHCWLILPAKGSPIADSPVTVKNRLPHHQRNQLLWTASRPVEAAPLQSHQLLFAKIDRHLSRK